MENFEKIKIMVNLQLLVENRYKKTIFFEGLQYGSKQKSVALVVKDLEIW